MKKIIYILFILVFSITVASAQSSSVYGKITDEQTGEELLYANIVLNINGVFATGASSDFEGNFSIPVDPGTYDMKISYTGYPDTDIENIVIEINKNKKLDIILSKKSGSKNIVVEAYKVPLIEAANNNNGNALTPEQIKDLPSKSYHATSSTLTYGPSQEDESDQVTVRCQTPRPDYYIEGIRVSGSLIPQKEIDSLSVMIPLEKLLGGTPASKENHDN